VTFALNTEGQLPLAGSAGDVQLEQVRESLAAKTEQSEHREERLRERFVPTGQNISIRVLCKEVPLYTRMISIYLWKDDINECMLRRVVARKLRC
jgi:hypothetical protein